MLLLSYLLSRIKSRKMTKKEYYKYLQSPEWAAIRVDIFFLTGGKCEKCGREGKQVHHKTYKNVGHEEPEDLILLCGRCHEIEHGLIKIKKTKKAIPKNQTSKKGKKRLRRKQRLLQVNKLQTKFDKKVSEKSKERIERRLKRMGLRD